MTTTHPKDELNSLIFTGVPTFLRLPHITDPHQLDVAIVGVPLDSGTIYRNGTRFGPRETRIHSATVRKYNPAMQINPYEKLRVADYGDIDVNPFSVENAHQTIEQEVQKIIDAGARPFAIGGDHSISLPILRALARKHGYDQLGMIHLDAHRDTSPEYFGQRYYHGSPFRCAIEENLLDPKKMIQIGFRGQTSDEKAFNFQKKHGITMIPIEEIFEHGISYVGQRIQALNDGGPFYLSFDIDVVDPAYAPGTGMPQVGGISSFQALQLIRLSKGIDIVGCDVVELSPPYDNAGITALLAANIVYEILCIL